MQFKPLPLVQYGGIQPFHSSTPQQPGMALMAMLAGRSATGMNPMDVQRGAQKAARRGPSSLLDTLAR